MYPSVSAITLVSRVSPTLTTSSAYSATAFKVSHQDFHQFSTVPAFNAMDCVLAYAAIGLLLFFSFVYLCLLGFSAVSASITEEAIIEPVNKPALQPVDLALDQLIDLVNQLDIESPVVDPIAKPVIDPVIDDLVVCFSKLSIRQSCFKASAASATASHPPRAYPENRRLDLVPALTPASAVKKSLRFLTVTGRPDVDYCEMHLFACKKGALKEKTPSQTCSAHLDGLKFVVFPVNRVVLLKQVGTFLPPKKGEPLFRPRCKILRHEPSCSECQRWRFESNDWETVTPAQVEIPVKLCEVSPRKSPRKLFNFT